jgi:hypothetical protein
MGLILAIALLIVALLAAAGGLILYALKKVDFIIIEGFGKSRAVTFPHFLRNGGHGASPAPYIEAVNTFLCAFFDSTEPQAAFGCDDIRSESPTNPVLSPLTGLDYDSIRCRLRVMSGLDPVVNRQSDTGTIHATIGNCDVKFRTLFTAKAASIVVEKIDA